MKKFLLFLFVIVSIKVLAQGTATVATREVIFQSGEIVGLERRIDRIDGLLYRSIENTISQATDKPFFTVEGEVLKPLKLTLEDLIKLQQAEVKAKGKDGQEHLYKGVRLVDILDAAGVTLGSQLRGENLAKYILVKAVDGYEVVFSIPEVDPEFTNQTILLAYQVDGDPLAKGDGPFRMVVPNDKRPARWVREISTIKIIASID